MNRVQNKGHTEYWQGCETTGVFISDWTGQEVSSPSGRQQCDPLTVHANHSSWRGRKDVENLQRLKSLHMDVVTALFLIAKNPVLP